MAEIEKKVRIVSGQEMDEFRTVGTSEPKFVAEKDGIKSTIRNEQGGAILMMEDNCGHTGHPHIQAAITTHDGSILKDKEEKDIKFPYDGEDGISENMYGEIYAIDKDSRKGTRIIVTNKTAYLTYLGDKDGEHVDCRVEKGNEILTVKDAEQAALNEGAGINFSGSAETGGRTISVSLEENKGLKFTDGDKESDKELTVDSTKVLRFEELNKEMPSGEICNLPYYFKFNANASEARVTAETITLDGNYKVETDKYFINIPAASSTAAGLMKSSDVEAVRDTLPKAIAYEKERAEDAEKKLTNEKIGLLGQAPDGGEYHLTYFYEIEPKEDYITAKVHTITLGKDGAKKDPTPYTLDVSSASTTKAGLMSSNDKKSLDALIAKSDVIDVVGTKAELDAYPTSGLKEKDVIKVLKDESKQNAETYYRWNSPNAGWNFIGSLGEFYTKTDADATFLKLSGGTMTGDLSMASHIIDMGEGTIKNVETGTDDDAFPLKKGKELFVLKELNGINGKSLIFNESDGGGAKFEGNSRVNSYIGVHDGSGNGIKAQIYAVKTDNTQGAFIDIKEDKIFYYTGKVKAASERDQNDNEIATKGDVNKFKLPDSAGDNKQYILKAKKENGVVSYEWIEFSLTEVI